jgi:hypothetical protein
MSNKFSILTNYLVSIFDANTLVNTISLREDDVIDVEKENVYPLVSMRLIESPPPQQNLRQFSYSFEIVNQRDDTKTATPSKLLTDTNYIDNIGVCDSIANDFLLEILKTHNEFDIDVIEDSLSDFEPVGKDDRNCLDGVKFECTFSLHQNAI